MDPSTEDLALKLSVVVDHLEQRAQQAAQTAEYGAQLFHQAAQNFGAQGQQISYSVIETVSTQAKQSVEQGFAQSMEDLRQQIKQAGETIAQNAKIIEDQAKALQKSQKTLIWKGGLALLTGVVLAVGGTSFITWYNLRELKRAQFGEDILHAAQTGAITRCGKELCVRTGEKPKTFGPNGGYTIVQDE